MAAQAKIALRHAESESDVAACFPLMRILRPHLVSSEEFAARAARQYGAGYRILAAWRDAVPLALAGYRTEENMIRGRFLYVDDLVTDEAERRNGLGARLLDALANEAERLDCASLVLDTALDNVLAHRFYYRQGLLASALRFGRPIKPQSEPS
jgi:ribosomal protein S18 acetylase RimI-like enzyme